MTVTSMTDFMGNTLNDKQSLEEIFDTLSTATLSIIEAKDLHSILRQITDVAGKLTDAEWAAMGIVDEDGAFAEFVSSDTNAANSSTADKPALIKSVIHHNRPLRRSDDLTNPTALNGADRGFLGVPITWEKQSQGAIILVNAKKDTDFTALDQKIVEILASHAAIAIRRQNLLKNLEQYGTQLRQRMLQLRALNQAAMAIAGELSLDSVLQQIVDSVRELVNARYAALGVPNDEGLLDAFIYSGMTPEEAAEMPHYPKGHGLLGAIIREKIPIRIPNIQKDPRSVGFPEGHPLMVSFLGVPVIANGEMLGNLYLTDKIDRDEFDAEDQEMVELLAAHAAIAIQNARLYEQVGRLAIIEERTRIGMDLHDGIIQSIYAVGLTLESTRIAMKDDPAEADELLATAIDALNGTIRDIRNFILDLRPHRFRGNLKEGLARLIREFQANTMVIVSLNASENAFEDLPTSVARSIFLTTQEALANIARHAKATEATIDIERTTSSISIYIADNGQGFDVSGNKERVGHGLSNMQARTEQLNGIFNIESIVGKGTSLYMSLPIRKTVN